MKHNHYLNASLLLPIALLIFASCASSALLGARMVLLGHHHQLYLVWNLFLAWLPLLFALVACWQEQNRRPRRWAFGGAAVGWFFFFPNAPYILTDLIHLGPRLHRAYWPDLVLILLFAFTGFVLGFLSLFLMQRMVAHRYGWPHGWLFVGAMAVLSGFGIYAGRFLRWNSWDVVVSPLEILGEGLRWVATMPSQPRGIILPILFGTMLFISYLVLYGLTHLQACHTAEPLIQTAPES